MFINYVTNYVDNYPLAFIKNKVHNTQSVKALSPEICFQLRDARRQAGLSQQVLAAEVGCKQSALSMFEQGRPTKLSTEVVEKLAQCLGVSLTAAAPSPGAPTPAPAAPNYAPGSGFCPNPQCPSNRAYQVAGRALYSPDRSAADPIGGRFCAVCGEVLERLCPNCGAWVHAGAVCSHCGQPYIA